MIIDLVEFSSSKDVNPIAVSLPNWEALVAKLSVFRLGPKEGRLWAPTTYKDGETRGNRGVDLVTAAVFDVDHATDDAIKELLANLTTTPFVMHSTFSDKPGDRCFRLVLPLPEPVKPLQWRNTTRQALIDLYGIPADPATKDPARIYYLPTAEQGEGTLYVGKGDATFSDVQQKLWAKKGVLRNIALGLPLATKNRDAAMQSAASSLAFMFPAMSTEEATKLVAPSIKAMPSDNGFEFELDKFKEKLSRARARKEEQDEKNQELAAVFAPEGQTPAPESVLQPKYDPSTLAGFNSKRWIIQHGSAYFFWVDGKYTCAKSREELPLGINQYLAKAPIPRSKLGAKDKRIPLTDTEIIKNNGTLADKYECSLVASESFFDDKTSTFVEALAPLRPFTPANHPDVDAWLRALGNGNSEKLLDWVAGVTQLNYQCCALLLEGDSGAGKGLLASGLASLWSDSGPSSVDVITGNWNSALTQCPFILADEGLPNTYKGSINDLLRQAIGSSNITLQRKYLPSATIKGCTRLLMASNNANMLKGFDDIGPEDRIAIAQRILLVEVHDGKARSMLEALPVEERDAWAQHKIAEHALYLRDTRKITRGKRFLVEGAGTTLTDRLTVSAGLASDLLELLVQTLNESKVKPSTHVVIQPGRVLVSSALYSNSTRWEAIVGSFKTPSSKQVKATLRNMADSVEELGGKKYYSIRVDLLDVWQQINQSDTYPLVRKNVLQ